MPLKLLPPFNNGQIQKLENKNAFLLAKNGLLEDEIISVKDDLKQLNDTSEDKSNTLENKLKRSWNELKEKMDEITLLKKSNKIQIDENFELKSELNNSGKRINDKDKTILKIENKIGNLEETLKKSKDESNALKQEKKKIEKKIKHLIHHSYPHP
jgi:chromosome segregation ATPase